MAITYRFDNTILTDLENGILKRPNLPDSAAWFLRRWRTEKFEVVSPPILEIGNARLLAKKIDELYRQAYSGRNGLGGDAIEEAVRL